MEGRPLADTILPPAGGWAFKASTDVGDVSWITPTTLLKVATWPSGCPPHTWQAVASGGGHLGESGMMLAAEAMAGAAVELLSDPGSLRQVRAEFERRTEGFTFVSGMPVEIGPPSVDPPQGYPSGTLEAR
jgi:aminobenzoyl-glutamate utilization protein B